ncbi:ribonuclease P protein component [Pseudonocardia pini]|uniref:ribonuclease P protein component n=1 Tax=Pseudonocardia pini TaxID=2758030 RepID=UPI0015F0CDB6|nr:ribonuclease P protein component [Pseudonocardia pini]
MLPAGARLTRRDEFASTIRRGGRAGRSRLVVHLDMTSNPVLAPRAGFVVSKAVGNAVVRHRVTRRLRHLVAARLDTLPGGSLLVVRALPPAAAATSAELATDLDSGLRSAVRKRERAR